MREPRLQVQASRSNAAGERSEQNPMPPASGASKSNAAGERSEQIQSRAREARRRHRHSGPPREQRIVSISLAAH